MLIIDNSIENNSEGTSQNNGSEERMVRDKITKLDKRDRKTIK